MNAPAREIIKALRHLGHQHDVYRAFSDSMEMIALAISNRVDLAQYEAREAQYLSVAKRYTHEELSLVAQIYAYLVAAFELGIGDYLGEIFMALELGNADRGQFFTPYPISLLMANIHINDELDARIAERGFVTVNDPAVGAGCTILAFADAMHQRGHNYQQYCHAIVTDVDIKSVHMAYIQFSLIGLPAVVVHGNSLTAQEHGHWYTPFHVLHGWTAKLRARSTVAGAPDPIFTLPAADLSVGQMELFL